MALVQVEYVGPLGSVRVPSVDGVAEAGKPINVSAEVAAGLLEQPDNWREVVAVKAPKGGAE